MNSVYSSPIKVGVIDRGNAGPILAERQKRAAAFSGNCGAKPFSGIDLFLQEPLDIVVGVASTDAVKDLAEKILLAGRDFIFLNAGSPADDVFQKELPAAAKKLHRRVHISSGTFVNLAAPLVTGA